MNFCYLPLIQAKYQLTPLAKISTDEKTNHLVFLSIEIQIWEDNSQFISLIIWPHAWVQFCTLILLIISYKTQFTLLICSRLITNIKLVNYLMILLNSYMLEEILTTPNFFFFYILYNIESMPKWSDRKSGIQIVDLNLSAIE